MAAQKTPRTTTGDELTLDEVERVMI